MFLVAGTFFPLTKLPQWAKLLAEVNPLFHTVELVRHAAFGWHGVTDIGHFAFLLAFAVLTWRLAIWRMTIRLID
jgi:lipooligosaccharide transport system permease protein